MAAGRVSIGRIQVESEPARWSTDPPAVTTEYVTIRATDTKTPTTWTATLPRTTLNHLTSGDVVAIICLPLYPSNPKTRPAPRGPLRSFEPLSSPQGPPQP